jgi:hypothetical protein
MMMIHTLNLTMYCNPEELLMKMSELAAAVAEVSAQLAKVQAEIINRIVVLEIALSELELPAEAVDALAALRTQAQSLDDIVPDVVPEPVVE